MAKSKKQQELTQKVQERLTGEAPLRVDASAVQSGGSRGASKSVHGIFPSMESAAQALKDAQMKSGMITTSRGMNVQVTKGSKSSTYNPTGEGMAPQQGKDPLPPLRFGLSQRYEQPITKSYGPEAVSRFVAEAEEIAARPNPLLNRSDGLVEAVMSLHTPSLGGNRRPPGSLSALAKLEDARLPKTRVIVHHEGDTSNFPSLSQEPYATGPRDLALKILGYSDEVQNRMLSTARDRVARRQGRKGFDSLSPVEVESRAQAQVQEHLDEALHGTKRVGHESAVINDALSSGGVGIETADGPANRAGDRPLVKVRRGGLGMTPSRTPEQRARRAVVRDVSRAKKKKPNPWDEELINEAMENNLALMSAKQKARRALGPAPETFNTMSPGADVDKKARRHAQPVFSTNNPGVGVPSEKRILPPAEARWRDISPVPPNLPSGPAEIGRSRDERRGTFPTGTEPVVPAKPGRKAAVKKEAAAGGGGGVGNWSPSQGLAAQTEKPEPLSGTGIRSGLAAARSQNVSLGRRGSTGVQSAYRVTR